MSGEECSLEHVEIHSRIFHMVTRDVAQTKVNHDLMNGMKMASVFRVKAILRHHAVPYQRAVLFDDHVRSGEIAMNDAGIVHSR